ncbi:hypothetical protein pb186bvf_000047 [Paramecium bursaria]
MRSSQQSPQTNSYQNLKNQKIYDPEIQVTLTLSQNKLYHLN